MGTCVDNVGFCAYPDPDCPSELRFDGGAGDGLANQCVGDTPVGSGTEAATSGDPSDTDPITLDDGDDGGPGTTSVDPTGGDASSGEDTVGACGGVGEDCCAGDECDSGLSCMGTGCGCVGSIAAGQRHTCAIKLDGSVWCWGANDAGQVGIVASPMEPLPVEVPAEFGPGMGALQIAAREHTCAVRENEIAICWGNNASGRADPQSVEPSVAPVLVTWAAAVTTVGVGVAHTCVGRSDEIGATCWGDNGSSQLTGAAAGPGPVDVMPAFVVDAIVGGAGHTCAMTPAGEVYCWGGNALGQLATDPVATPSSAAPLLVTLGAIGPVSGIASGDDHVCVVVDGGVTCWGRNHLGQLGDGTDVNATTPVAATLPAGVTADRVVAGPNHTCALATSGALHCWGSNANGQLMLRPDKMGNDQYTLVPQAIEVGSGVLQVATGATQTCVLSEQGTVLCWGINNFGQNGDGTTDYGFDPTPAQIDCP